MPLSEHLPAPTFVKGIGSLFVRLG